MLVDDLGHQRSKRFQTVDVLGIHEHTIGQCPRLVATGLMRGVEVRAHLRVLCEHGLIEVGDERLAALFKERHS
nr:hypothetical protein [Xanthomonas albilineans]